METTFPLPWGTWTLNTSRTRVFLRPMSVSPFRSSMSEFRSFRIPAQSMLGKGGRVRGPPGVWGAGQTLEWGPWYHFSPRPWVWKT